MSFASGLLSLMGGYCADTMGRKVTSVLVVFLGILSGMLCLSSVFEVQMIGVILLLSFGNIYMVVQNSTLNEVTDDYIRNKFQGF